MTNRLILLAVLSAVVAFPSAASSILPWARSGTWLIARDMTAQGACFASIVYPDGTIFRVGFRNRTDPNALYVGLGNRKWPPFEPGKQYPVSFQFGNGDAFTAAAVAVSVEGVPFLFANTSSGNFVKDIMTQHTLRVSQGKHALANISLRGSPAAMNELSDCQKAEPPQEPSTDMI